MGGATATLSCGTHGVSFSLECFQVHRWSRVDPQKRLCGPHVDRRTKSTQCKIPGKLRSTSTSAPNYPSGQVPSGLSSGVVLIMDPWCLFLVNARNDHVEQTNSSMSPQRPMTYPGENVQRSVPPLPVGGSQKDIIQWRMHGFLSSVLLGNQGEFSQMPRSHWNFAT